jgi:uncharacterized protein YkwD
VKHRLLLLCLLLACAVWAAGAATSAPRGGTANTRLTSLEERILVELNRTRRTAGLRPLARSSGLTSAALFHSRAMVLHGFFSHESWDGSSFEERVRTRYTPQGWGRWSVGENLLFSSGGLSGAAAVRAWLDSPPHRRNMLSATWREVGIGAVFSPAAAGVFRGGPTWVVTMDFGYRAGRR